MGTTFVSKTALGVQRFEFSTTFLDRGRTSRNWGPTLRGGFGRCLRKVACSLARDSCQACPLGAACPYGYIFETPIAQSETIMRKYPQAPHPFVFEPNLQGKTQVQAGETLNNSLVVIGAAVRYLPYFFLAIEELGREGFGSDRVRFRVEHVAIQTGATVFQHPRTSNFEQAELVKLSLEPGSSSTARFSLEFQTAARIKVDGRITRNPSLEDIVKALCRRAFLLRHFHCGHGEEPVSSDFIDAAREARCLGKDIAWSDAARYSTRQKRQVPIGGVVGRITYEGDLGVLRPLLRAGEYVHVGKNATFGLGKYVLTEGARP